MNEGPINDRSRTGRERAVPASNAHVGGARVALCIVGAARGLPRRDVYESLKAVADAVSEDNVTQRADVFLQLQLAESDDDGHSRGTGPNRFKLDDFGRALRALQPVAFDVSDRHGNESFHATPHCTNPQTHGPVCVRGTELACKYWPQAARWHACYDLVVEYEKRRRWRYDWGT